MPAPDNESELQDRLTEMIEERRSHGGFLTRRFGCWGRIVGFVLVPIVLLGMATFTDAAESPWAYSIFGLRSTLTGEWYADFTAPSGLQGVAYLNLTHPMSSFDGMGQSSRRIEGVARTCFTATTVQVYETYGRPNTSASKIDLAFRPRAPFIPGHALEDLHGAWYGLTLSLSGPLTHITDTSGSTIYDPSDIDRGTTHDLHLS